MEVLSACQPARPPVYVCLNLIYIMDLN